jgi:hypothetical protein
MPEHVAHCCLAAFKRERTLPTLKQERADDALPATLRYDLVQDPTGWTVWDHESDGPALFGGEILSGQARSVSDMLVAFLNDVEASRASARRRPGLK